MKINLQLSRSRLFQKISHSQKGLTKTFLCSLVLALLFITVSTAKTRRVNGIYSKQAASLQKLVENDQAIVLQKCLDLPELQNYYSKNEDGSFQQVYIMQYLVTFPVDLAVSKFQKNIVFLSRQDISSNNVESFFVVKTFSIEGDKARVVFDYSYKNVTTPATIEATINLSKSDGEWNVLNSSIKTL